MKIQCLPSTSKTDTWTNHSGEGFVDIAKLSEQNGYKCEVVVDKALC